VDAGGWGVERGFLGAVGIGIALFSGFFVAAAGVELATGKSDTTTGVLTGLLVFFLGTGVAGAYLAWAMLRRRQPGPTAAPRTTDADRERQVLLFAETEQGRVTITEVATHCEMSVAEAKHTLDRLVSQQVADIHVSDGGVLVYVFPGFLSDDDKARADDFA
jgi:hypothetical protein